MFAMFSGRLGGCQSALGDVTSVAAVLARWLSLPARRSAEPSLKLLESVPLTAQASLALVRFGAENLVLGVTAQTITVLAKAEAVAGAKPEERQGDIRTHSALGAAQFDSDYERQNLGNPIP
jgi:flagellar biogenesis protein FliO